MLVVLGGYVAAAGIVAVLSATLPFTGLPRIDSVVLASMLGFVIYLVLLLWGFAERRLIRLAAIQALLAAGGFGLASFIGAGG